MTRCQDASVHEFLVKEFSPVFKSVQKQAIKLCNDAHISLSKPLIKKFRTLSPSDFGFHNCLRINNTQLVFLDFEYFGWDDPVKMISDFVLHPRNTIRHTLKQHFIDLMIQEFKGDQNIRMRLQTYCPLYALKWCTILLNEFIEADLSRREFAKGKLNHDHTKKQQLMKARKMLQTAIEFSNTFPYNIY
jgi:thiamine kinase-like enzyme